MRFFLIILSFALGMPVFSRTIIAGSNQPVSTLKKAIDMAKNKDTILLQPGSYREGTITITKSITIIGINNPVLDGENKYEILVLSGRDITISGIRFKDSRHSSSNDYAAINIIDASNITITNCKIFNAHFGIHVGNAIYCTIRNNDIQGFAKSEQSSGNGIHLWKCSHILIENNHIRGHRDGIYFEFVTDSEIRNNTSENNLRYGLHFMFSHSDNYFNNQFKNNGAGVAVMYSHNVKMENNSFENNWGPSAYGILLKEITDSHIKHNSFLQNTIGIYMEGANRIEVEKNTFRGNGWAMKVLADCDNNTFHNNNYLSNSFDVATNGSVSLNNFYNNYWDKYEGYDMNKDGIGDIPYHPVSMYSMIVEQNPTTLMLFRSFMVSLLDKAEKAVPGLTPENLIDNKPMMKSLKL
jgi:nitrous oxidase accessory protein